MLVGPLPELGAYLVWAAIELGLATGEVTCEALVARYGRRAARLVDAWRALGLVEAADAGEEVWRGPRTAGQPPAGAWSQLAVMVRADRSVAQGEHSVDAGYLSQLDAWARAPAASLAARLAELPLPDGVVLDLGCGAGTYGRVVARHLGRDAVLCDRPAVIEVVKQLDQTAAWWPRDLLDDRDGQRALPSAAAVLLCNLLHLYDAATAARLLATAAAALRPGGWLVVRELVIDADRRAPLRSVLFALNMALFTDGGDVHEAATIERLLAAAGLSDVRAESIDDEPESRLFFARRPA